MKLSLHYLLQSLFLVHNKKLCTTCSRTKWKDQHPLTSEMQEEPFSARPLASLAKMLKRIYLISDTNDDELLFHTLIEEALIH